MPEINENVVVNDMILGKKNALDEDSLDAVIEAAKEAIPKDVVDMREIKESVEVNPDAELEPAIADSSINGDGLIAETKTPNEVNVSIFDADNDDARTEAAMKSSANAVQGAFDLTDEETMQLLDLMAKYRKDPNYPIYKNMPDKMQQMVRVLAQENNIPTHNWNQLARMMLSEIINDAEIDKALLDMQKSLDEALNIPSIVDMYCEHTYEVMNKHIPEMIEKIKDEAPDKAELLAKIKERFQQAYNFSLAKEMYENNARLRKALRRYDSEIKRALNEFNFRNEKSKFKMNDVTELPGVLNHILVNEPLAIADAYEKDSHDIPERIKNIIDLDVTTTDIEKFCVLVAKSCENMDPDNIVDASYMYYLMKNIIALKHTQEAKTDFAAELIINICDTIAFIRNKEAEFDEQQHLDERKRKQKRGST